MNARKMYKALDEVALLTRAINLSMARYPDDDGKNINTAIDALHEVITGSMGDSESRATAKEACETLRALQDAVDLLHVELRDMFYLSDERWISPRELAMLVDDGAAIDDDDQKKRRMLDGLLL